MEWFQLAQDRDNSAGWSEYGSELFRSIKCREFLDCDVYKNDPVP